MQAFNGYLKVLKKNLGGAFIYIVIFMVITVCFSNVSEDPVNTAFAMEKLDIAVIDRDNTELSKGFKDYLGTIHNLVEIDDDKEALQDNLFYRNVSYILFIPQGYSDQLTKGNIDHLVENVKVPNSFEGIFMDKQVDQYIKTVAAYVKAGLETDKCLSLTKESLGEATEVTKLEAEDKVSAAESNPLLFFYQFFAYVLICIIIIGLGPILLQFSQPDIKRRIDVSSLSLRKKNKQLIAFSFLFSTCVWLAFVLLSMVVYGAKMFTTTGLLCIINSFLYMLVSLSITYLITLLVKKKSALSLISNVVGLGMSFLCGIFVPQQYMSEKVLSVARILPGYWYMDAHNAIGQYGGTTAELQKICADYGIVFGFAIAILAISLVISKVKQGE